jgi:phosphorylcholine metabolism protein LicD
MIFNKYNIEYMLRQAERDNVNNFNELLIEKNSTIESLILNWIADIFADIFKYDYQVSHLLVNDSQLNKFLDIIALNIYCRSDAPYTSEINNNLIVLWGAKIVSSEYIPKNLLLAVGEHGFINRDSVRLGKLDMDLILKIKNMQFLR